jgi:ABC-type uncharacterized transport system substrate-binding protein
MKNRLPTSFAFREYVEVGGLVSYGVNFAAIYRRAAEYANRILRGTKRPLYRLQLCSRQ